MKILVTGGLGFIGHNLAKKLIEEGNEVHIYDNHSNAKVISVMGAIPCYEFRYNQWDLVYHMAAVAQIEQGYNYELINSNILLSREVMNLQCRVIYASSAAVKQPKTLYALSKIDNDHYASLRDNCTGVRFENVYGHKDNGVIGKVLKACINKKPFTLNGGNQRRDFVYIDDVVDALLWAKYSKEKIIPIGTGVVHSIHEVITIAERITGKILEYDHAKLADHEIKYSICESPLKSFVSLDEGMKQHFLALTT